MSEVDDGLLRRAGRAFYFGVPLVLAGVEFGGYYALFGAEFISEIIVSGISFVWRAPPFTST